MEIRNLNTFLRVAELHSFSKTARELGYSQSAVSTQIKQLEDELCTSLFDRIGRSVSLTERGKEFLLYAQDIIRLSQEAKTNMKSSATVSGELRLAMAESLCISLFPEILKNFQKKYPQVHITIKTGITNEMFRMLLQNEVDMIYTLDERIYQKDLELLLDEPEPICFAAPIGHPLVSYEHLSLKDLTSYGFLLTEKDMSYRRQLDQKLASMNLYLEPLLELGNTEIIKHLVKDGMGLSFLPKFVIQKELENKTMAYLKVDDFSSQVWRQLIRHKGKWVTPAMDAMYQMIYDQNKKLKK